MTETDISNRDKVLLLWDIDGTLLDTGGIGVKPFTDAATKYLRREVAFNRTEMAGKTDFQIIDILSKQTQTNTLHKIVEYMILKEYTSGLVNNLKINPVKLLGDTKFALSNLARSDFFELGILTGNCKMGMRAKLKSAGILDFFPPANIFCASRKLRSREEILSSALIQVKKKVIIIGDTPNDIHAARSCRRPIVSLATGAFSYEKLCSINPNNVLDVGWTYDELLMKLSKL